MSAQASIVTLSSDEIRLFQDFHAAEALADRSGRPLAAEMIEAVSYERDRLGASLRRANEVYGAAFDDAGMRRYVVLRYAIDVLERMAEHKAEIVPLLFPELAPRRRRV